MDVVVTPVGSVQSAGGTWRLEDRLGRVLGMIRQIPWTSEFTIVAEPVSRLYGVPAVIMPHSPTRRCRQNRSEIEQAAVASPHAGQ